MIFWIHNLLRGQKPVSHDLWVMHDFEGWSFPPLAPLTPRPSYYTHIVVYCYFIVMGQSVPNVIASDTGKIDSWFSLGILQSTKRIPERSNWKICNYFVHYLKPFVEITMFSIYTSTYGWIVLLLKLLRTVNFLTFYFVKWEQEKSSLCHKA